MGLTCCLSLILLICAVAVPKDYSMFGRVVNFKFASDVSAKNCRIQNKCNTDILVNWKKELQSSCFSTPVIYPIHQEGKEDIIVNGFWKYTDVVSSNGISYEEWPYDMADNRFYSSPILFDIDQDGMEELISVDDNGVIRIVKLNDNHTPKTLYTIEVPPIHVNRHWFENVVEITTLEGCKQATAVPDTSDLMMHEGDRSEQYAKKKAQQAQQYIHEEITHVLLDPHVLTTVGSYYHPTTTDLYLTLPLSYYLSSHDYRNGIRGLVMEKYLACGVMMINLSKQTVEWSTVLGISTINAASKAYIYSTPITVDLEGLGQPTTLVTTSQGLLYALDHQGQPRRGFPVRFSEIQMSPVAADIAGDGYLEIIVGDRNGVLAVVDYRGEEVWSRRLSGPLSQTVSIGDVDGDGRVDVVAVTDTGDVWIVRGENGMDVNKFPVRTGNTIKSMPLLVDLSRDGRGIHIVLATSDGDLLIIDGRTGCVRRIDITDEVYARVLAMKMPDSELIALVVATMNGNLIQFVTGAEWSSKKIVQNGGGNMESIYLPHYMSIYFGTGKEQWIDSYGEQIALPITIVDQRANHFHSTYHIRVIRKGRVLVEKTVEEAGSYVVEFTSQEMGYYNVMVLLTNEHAQTIRLDVSIHANVEILHYLKYLILIPFLILTSLLLLSSNLGTPLPL